MFDDKIKRMLGSSKSTNVMGNFGLKPLNLFKLKSDCSSKNMGSSGSRKKGSVPDLIEERLFKYGPSKLKDIEKYVEEHNKEYNGQKAVGYALYDMTRGYYERGNNSAPIRRISPGTYDLTEKRRNELKQGNNYWKIKDGGKYSKVN